MKKKRTLHNSTKIQPKETISHQGVRNVADSTESSTALKRENTLESGNTIGISEKNMQKPQNDELNPWGIEYVPYERYLVRFIDALLNVAKKNGSKSRVETSFDWNTIEFMYKGWRILFPQTAESFEKHMNDVRHHSNTVGTAKEKGGAEVQYQLELPRPLHDMMKVIFPDQKWDKKFIQSFIKHFPTLRAAEKI